MTTEAPHSPPPDALIDGAAGRSYWAGVDASVSGMLGGLPAVGRVDLQGSRAFLAKMGVGSGTGLRRAGRVLEGGAGIGRVTQALLLPLCATVDAIEPIPKFAAALEDTPGVEKVFTAGLEEWQPAPEDRYDIIWNQWCVGHLTDEELVGYLVRCKGALTEGGFVVLKENVSTLGRDYFDAVDSSVTREDKKYRTLFERAGLAIARTELQNGLPRTLLPVRSYALRPKP